MLSMRGGGALLLVLSCLVVRTYSLLHQPGRPGAAAIVRSMAVSGPRRTHSRQLTRPAGHIMVSPLCSSRSESQAEGQISASPSQRVMFDLKGNWKRSVKACKANPVPFVTIPVVAALVGLITNYIGVKMLFYPLQWTGVPLKRWAGLPWGLVGWQGIVPAKREVMAGRIVDVTISQLLDVNEVFGRLEPHAIANVLTTEVTSCLIGARAGASKLCVLPRLVTNWFLRRTATDLVKNIENVVNVREVVVGGLTRNPATLVRLFETVARKELSFLIYSGFGFGFLLGLLQMLQWMAYPAQWTLPIGGTVVGLVTNWIALKWIFEPLEPVKCGPVVLQGMFLRRQKEVSSDFCHFVADEVLDSRSVWTYMLNKSQRGVEAGSTTLRNIMDRNLPLPSGPIDTIVSHIKEVVSNAAHPLHKYANKRLELYTTLCAAMNKLSPAQFEQVLHPVFQQDEVLLIIAGGVLGFLAGALQWAVNVYLDKQKKERGVEAEAAATTKFKPAV